MNQSDSINYQRTIWHSRRGMLELDLLLAPFVREHYPLLDTRLQQRYVELLAREDDQLYQWLVLSQPSEACFVEIIKRIRDHVPQSAS